MNSGYCGESSGLVALPLPAHAHSPNQQAHQAQKRDGIRSTLRRSTANAHGLSADSLIGTVPSGIADTAQDPALRIRSARPIVACRLTAADVDTVTRRAAVLVDGADAAARATNGIGATDPPATVGLAAIAYTGAAITALFGLARTAADAADRIQSTLQARAIRLALALAICAVKVLPTGSATLSADRIGAALDSAAIGHAIALAVGIAALVLPAAPAALPAHRIRTTDAPRTIG